MTDDLTMSWDFYKCSEIIKIRYSIPIARYDLYYQSPESLSVSYIEYRKIKIKELYEILFSLAEKKGYMRLTDEEMYYRYK